MRLLALLRVTLLAALLCIPLSAKPKPPSLASLDLEVCTRLTRLGELTRQAGTLMENWVSGRGGSTVETQLQRLRQDFEREQKQLLALRGPATAQGLFNGARRCAEQRRKALSEAVALASTGKLDGQRLRDYWRATLDATRVSQREWFRCRLAFVQAVIATPQPAAVTHFYQWQSQILKAWMEESELAAEAQLLLAQPNEKSEQRNQLQQKALALMKRGLSLQERSRALKVSTNVQPAHSAALLEQAALARFCEYLSYFFDDPSSDSLSRLRRGLRQLSEASAAVEESTLKELRRSLGNS